MRFLSDDEKELARDLEIQKLAKQVRALQAEIELLKSNSHPPVDVRAVIQEELRLFKLYERI